MFIQKLSCLNLSQTYRVSFSIFFAVPPLYIHIQGLNHPLTSGVKVHLSCSTAGARPIPQIAWTKGTQTMQGASQTVSN